MFDKVTDRLVRLTLIDDPQKNNGCRYILRAVYNRYYTNGKIEEIIFPRIELPFVDQIPDCSCDISLASGNDKYFDIGKLRLIPNMIDGTIYQCRTVKEADAKEMTLAEIEEKLGYPVKIVKEK